MLRGNIELAAGAGRGAPVASRWDLDTQLQQGSVDCGIELSNIHGGVRLSGSVDGAGSFHCLGQMDLDAATYNGFQFTQIRGPLEIRQDRILFGAQARRIGLRQTPVPITATIYDGIVSGNCQVVTGNDTAFSLQAQLTGASLRRFAREMIPGRQNLSGRVLGTLQLAGLAGNERGTNSLKGGGKIRLRDANVYELPLMIALLKLVSVRPPDATAFTKSDMDFRIEGDHIYLDRINFNGDAISLLGQGEMDWNRRVKLNFYSIVGRNELRVPVISQLVGEASKQTWEIRVDGTLDDPKVRSEAFPGLKKFLQQVKLSSQGASIFAPPTAARGNERNRMRPR